MVVRLIGKEALAEGTIAFRFDKPQGFDFVAGQHIEIKLPGMEKGIEGGDSRIFSVASAPHENFLMVATRMTGSPFKEALARTDIGTEVEINGPWGDFVLHKDNSLPAVFLIGGIGITPARSIVADSIKRETDHELYLFYSNRRPEDTAFQSDLKKYEKLTDNFQLIETMTQMKESDAEWNGEESYIDKDLIEKHLDDVSEAVYYIAGPPKMVKAMKKTAEGLGADDLHIKIEEFSGY